MAMSVSVEFGFAAAHALPYSEGPCRRLHGHNYRLVVTVEGMPKGDGMVRDFDEIKRTVWESVLSRIDHTLLNDLLENPTAENLAIWLWRELGEVVPRLAELKIWETPEYCVTYRLP
jgi:6-pyruvoyltetrahydropterin/6-carboxytetrahydropterin synthase